MSTEDRDFDVTALIALCANWPTQPVPTGSAHDSLLDRLRQLLANFQTTGSTFSHADFVPLVRHVLLRRGGGTATAVPWLKVPSTGRWPAASTWSEAQFDVVDLGGWVQVRPRMPRMGFLQQMSDLFDDAFAGVVARVPSNILADPFLERTLGLGSYTGDGQREALRALLHLPPGDTLFANLPTGSGKSLIAQVTPLIESQGMLTLAIVPTVALAIDQGRRMGEFLIRRFPHAALPPLAYHGGLTQEERKTVWNAIRTGTQPVLFTSPEHATGSLRKILEEAALQKRLSHVVVDEAHLVVGWGNGFRPAFQLIPALVSSLRKLAGEGAIRVALASATLTSSTVDALRRLFGPPARTYMVAAVHLRPEPRYAFMACADKYSKRERVLEALRLAPRPFILYVTRPDEADGWLLTLRGVGMARVAKFTGETAPVERETLLKAWGENRLDGMVATSAFGLGVDKSDVRTVVHATLPESLDRFYQEVGRAGRDGQAAASLLLYAPDDVVQARGMAGDKLIGDDTGFERWSLLIDNARPAEESDVYWVELGMLPAHLRVRTEASALWNVRTLTLMARAGLIQLVSLSTRTAAVEGETPQNLSAATHAAVRIVDPGHRTQSAFYARMQQARQEVWNASERGVKAIEAVASGRTEVSEALRKTYSIKHGVWAPVTTCCGGCAMHWDQRRDTVLYRPPHAGRLQRFSSRVLSAIERHPLPRAAANLLVIDLPRDETYGAGSKALVEALARAVRPHTWALERRFALRHLPLVRAGLSETVDDRSFIDVIAAECPQDWTAGENEVRVVFWPDRDPPPAPDTLWHSQASLELLVVPSDLPHPANSARRLIDTTPHVHAANLLQLLTA